LVHTQEPLRQTRPHADAVDSLAGICRVLNLIPNLEPDRTSQNIAPPVQSFWLSEYCHVNAEHAGFQRVHANHRYFGESHNTLQRLGFWQSVDGLNLAALPKHFCAVHYKNVAPALDFFAMLRVSRHLRSCSFPRDHHDHETY